MQGLNTLFSSHGLVRVLRCLHKADGPLSGRCVERRTGLSNRGAMIALAKLVDSGVVTRTGDGRAHAYSLSRHHYLANRILKPAFEAEDLFWTDVARTVRRIVRPRPLAAIATGPLARGETDSGGRLVLSLLFSSGHNRIRSLATIASLAEAVRERYNMALENHLADLRTMGSEEYAPLRRRARREGILLFGALP